MDDHKQSVSRIFFKDEQGTILIHTYVYTTLKTKFITNTYKFLAITPHRYSEFSSH